MSDKHTPGPWVSNEDMEVWSTTPMRFNLTTSGTPMIASVCRHDDAEVGFPARANARIIAAAPDLLSALVALDGYLNNNLSTDYPTGIDLENAAFKAAHAAIAKATGERND